MIGRDGSRRELTSMAGILCNQGVQSATRNWRGSNRIAQDSLDQRKEQSNPNPTEAARLCGRARQTVDTNPAGSPSFNPCNLYNASGPPGVLFQALPCWHSFAHSAVSPVATCTRSSLANEAADLGYMR